MKLMQVLEMISLFKHLEDPVELMKTMTFIKTNHSTYFERVLQLVNSLKPGDCFLVDNMVKAENKCLFIECLCCIIGIYNRNEYEFSSDFSQFRRQS